jgi:polyphosphate kinase 2 (PPK2 family)
MLKPVESDDRIPLTDADARAPRRLPTGDARDRELEELRDELAGFQQKLYAEGTRALLVVLQGRDASGKDGLIRKVFTAFSPQGCTVTSFKAPAGAELRHDYLWRIHAAVPAFGTVGVFNRSHYEDVLVPRAAARNARPGTWCRPTGSRRATCSSPACWRTSPGTWRRTFRWRIRTC